MNEKYNKFVTTLTDVKIETNNSKWVLKGIFLVQEKTGINVSIEEQVFEEEISNGF